MKRKEPLIVGEIYHILNKSIAGYKIFNSKEDYQRILQIIRFFCINDKQSPKFSRFILQNRNKEKSINQILYERVRVTPTPITLVHPSGGQRESGDGEEGEKEKERVEREEVYAQVQIIAYSIMPTHIHLILKQLRDNGISNFMGNVSNSYARYFNTKYEREGHLWKNTFRNVAVKSDDQLLHLTRYVHLNAVTAGIVESPDQWEYSSYKEYIEPENVKYPLCSFNDLLNINPLEYCKFVEDWKNYQRELAKIKKIILE